MKQETLVQLLFSAKGRINRQKFLFAVIGWVALIMVMMVISSIFTAMAMNPDASSFWSVMAGLFGIINIVIYIAMMYSSIALQIKRWHDLDRSGWFTLLGFLPIVNLIYAVYVYCVKGTTGDNQFGKDPLA